jgi:predicted N-formylglutamate amidohydrolase
MSPETAGSAYRLLAADEPPAVIAHNEGGRSPFFLTCDHAGRAIPRRLGSLGLPETELSRHIALDIGALGVAEQLSLRLDAALIAQPYSRLVIDSNRAPEVASSIVEISELTEIPGNRNLSRAEIEARRREIFEPYHRRIVAALDQRLQQGRPTVLIAMHSFTPIFKGVSRPWQIGVLYNRDARFADIMLDLLRQEGDLTVGDNEPYAVGDLTDYTIPVHGEQRGIPHVELEIRQDLIANVPGQTAWANRLTRVLAEAYRRLVALRRPV